MEKGCLPVPKVKYNRQLAETDVSNLTAEQYMAWVREEADELPSVVRVEVECENFSRQTKYMPEIDAIEECPEHLQPTEDWVCDVLYAFSELRLTLDRLGSDKENKERSVKVPAMKDANAWSCFCLGVPHVDDSEGGKDMEDDGAEAGDTKMDTNMNEEEQEDPLLALLQSKKRALELVDNAAMNEDGEVIEERGKDKGKKNGAEEKEKSYEKWEGVYNHQPTTALLLQFDQVLTQRLLSMHVDWLCETDESRLYPLEKRGQWLYGLLARLEKPLYQDAAAVVRRLYRRCCALRFSLGIEDSSDILSFDSDIAAINVVISITGSYFRQGEAAGYVRMIFRELSLYSIAISVHVE